jgi:hypothetical protein
VIAAPGADVVAALRPGHAGRQDDHDERGKPERSTQAWAEGRVRRLVGMCSGPGIVAGEATREADSTVTPRAP